MKFRINTFAAAWGIGGVLFLLSNAAYRIGAVGFETMHQALTPFQWVFMIGGVVFLLGTKGYLGFQRNFAPRVAARARHLYEDPQPLKTALAPLFCMAFFHTTKKRRIITYSFTSGIILMIIGVRMLPQPWRGLIDVGVASGLLWGIGCVLVFTFQAFTVSEFPYSPELPVVS